MLNNQQNAQTGVSPRLLWLPKNAMISEQVLRHHRLSAGAVWGDRLLASHLSFPCFVFHIIPKRNSTVPISGNDNNHRYIFIRITRITSLSCTSSSGARPAGHSPMWIVFRNGSSAQSAVTPMRWSKHRPIWKLSITLKQNIS